MGSATSWATIEFPASALKDAEIRSLLDDYGVEFDDDLKPILRDDDPRVEVEDGIFNLHHGDVNYGTFDYLEDELIAQNIPFDRQTGMDWSISPHLRVFRPGTPAFDQCYPMDEDGTVVVSVETIRQVMVHSNTKRGAAFAIEEFLNEHYPPYPPLSDFVKEEIHE